ncbi:glycosyltransferase family 4 protein [Microbacterium sp. Sa1CUA4]|uniref:D-inositol 3-phosphate glycosyltransferase n=2 Tax=Microbacterium gallinarum TaxID=2762209 RepID=A0ABR8X378_9MICO|nr:glycosyltransferase family 4 protein [Microbacterium gallinarum]
MTGPPTRVLLMGLNYPPERTGVAPYTGAAAAGLRLRGIATGVITAHPHYPSWRIFEGYGQWSRRETIADVDVRRVRHYVPRKPSTVRRVVSELTFGARQVWTRWGSPDVIVAVSPALLATALVVARAKLISHGTPVVVWVQDLYTVGVTETGRGGRGSRRAISAIEGWVLRNAAAVIVIHKRFADRITKDFGVPGDKIQVVRNWAHLGPMSPLNTDSVRASHGWRDDETVVLHAGNIGVKQGLENVIEAARLAADRKAPLRFVFLGGGGERDRIRALANHLPTVQFIDPLPDEEFASTLIAADVLLVNEKAGVAEMAVPSKLTSYFSTGRPVLAATDHDGITAEEVAAAGAGLVVASDDPASLLAGALALRAQPEAARRHGENGLRYRQTVLDEETALDRLSEILTAVAAERATPSGRQHTTAAEAPNGVPLD